ncbi:TonB-dependent receptor [Pseudoalteromonas sp. MMG022]|uniref:TonB-dependent receptor n=1 Tax=Pseudoalteromonas sp. MMG022 TaxID=2909978 RepID=UPI001F188A6A|nr:TonB-dependent receptor [Pseudoalteromonas sp. MMG022]MCF6434307.1 TonB-dependent receptor [Pseudoalteromonas sp. MMG022]
MKNVRLTKVAGALALALGVSASAFASDTSSAMRGKITTPSGDAAANVKVTVIHEPTGTVSTFTTNESGAFIAKGLRVGGPYRVVLDSDKFSDAQLDNIFLELGDTHRIVNQLEPLQQVEKIEVTGYKIVQQAGGSNSVFGADTIANVPSFNNDIKDVARLNPLASINGNGELSIAGGNPRTNGLTVDGIGQNDDFGLNYGGYPTSQPPVALDAIEQISVDSSPFSAKKGNFGGGTINAVTKSGSNEYTFTGFYETSTPSLAGKVDNISEATYKEDVLNADGEVIHEAGDNIYDDVGHKTFETSSTDPIITEKRFGFSTGGAIVKDELFYFVNYNSWKQEMDMDYGFDGSGTAHEFDVKQDDYNRFINTLSSVYGVEDSFGGNPEDTSDSLLIKLSWNINDLHRADFTYQWQDESDARGFSTGGSSITMASSRYDYTTKFDNFAAKLYSDWSDDFSTEIGVAYKNVSNDSVTNSDLGTIKVYVDGGRGDSFEFGRDVYRHRNEAETETLALTFDATYLMGDHEITFGAQLEDLRLYNLFAENSMGSWTFGSLEDFENKKLHINRDNYQFTYANSYTGDVNDLAYDATRSQLALYIEDKFYPTDDLEMTAGLRYERLSSSDKPTLNTAFQETYGYTNQENLDGIDIILPRVGFKYYATESLTVNGGIGRFQGGIPNVWYNAPFQNDGITFVEASQNAINDYFSGVEQVDFTRVPGEITGSLQQGAGSTAYTDPDFELPSSVRAQLGFEYDFDSELLGDGFKWTAELAYHKKENEAVWRNTAIKPVGESATGRIIYESIYEGDLRDNFDIMMTNADEDGRSIILSTSIAKEWDNGLYVSASYAHQDVEDVNPGSSSRAESNYKHAAVHSRNVDLVGRGHYEVEHSFKLNLRYNTEFFEGYASKFNVFFERRSGRPFSYTMGSYRDGDFGDTRSFNSTSAYLAYIPTGADDANVNWEESGLSWDQLEALLNRAGISERGQLLDRNTGTQPWVTTMDVSFKQEIPGFYEGHKGELYIMVENFANLLNSDWGIEKKISYSDQKLYDFGGLDDNGKLIIDERYQGSDVRNYSEIVKGSSAWQAKIGIRYTF